MSSPVRGYTTDIGTLSRDTTGALWLIHQHVSRTGQAADYMMELICRSIFVEGGIITPGSAALVGSVITVTGPHFGVTLDGLTPLMLDPEGDGEELDLSAYNAFADGTHLVVVRALPVTVNVNFTSPQRVVRDPSGNVIETLPSEALTHVMTSTLGVLALEIGEIPAAGDVPVATVVKSGSSWSTLVPALDAPIYRWGAGS